MSRLILCFLFFLSAPAFAISDWDLKDMNGSGNYSSAGRNSSYVLEFYFNSCPACNNNAGNVKEIYDEYHSDRVQVLEVSIDCDESDYSSWIRKHKPDGPVLNSCDGSIQDELSVQSFPTTIILNCRKEEVARYVGTWSSSTKQKIRDKLFELLFMSCEQ